MLILAVASKNPLKSKFNNKRAQVRRVDALLRFCLANAIALLNAIWVLLKEAGRVYFKSNCFRANSYTTIPKPAEGTDLKTMRGNPE